MDTVTVHHPDLPGQPVQMTRPRNGWVPVEETGDNPPQPLAGPRRGGQPRRGQSRTKKKPKE